MYVFQIFTCDIKFPVVGVHSPQVDERYKHPWIANIGTITVALY